MTEESKTIPPKINVQIGNVRIHYIRTARTDEPVYCDGDQELRLFENIKKNNHYRSGDENMKFSSWVEEYHLSPVRQNLLKWIPFEPECSVLEVGAGCGALTGVLAQKLKKVTALEYSEQRAMITAMRHQQYGNLEVIVGGLQDFATETKFDYITVIGVLEYAGRFYGGSDPYKSFLIRLEKLLKPDGTLMLAIENRIGVKYLCGAREDHTGRIFESIYNYPYSNGVQTFSKKELTNLLNASGFGNLEWYYPLPDYKLPRQIISDDTLPRDLDLIWDLFPNGSRDKNIMSEKRLAKTLRNAGLFSEFTNSFFVFARTRNVPEKPKCIHFFGANMKRKRKFRTNKKIFRNGGKTQFIISPDNEEAVEFINEIARRELSAKDYFGENAEAVTGELSGTDLVYPYISYPGMLELIARQINSGDTEFGKNLIEQYLAFLSKLPAKKCVPQEFMKELGLSEDEILEPVKCLECGIIDCVPRNIMVDSERDKYCIIDNEFTFDFPFPFEFLIWSAINTLVIDLQDQIQSQVNQNHPVAIFSGHGINRYYIPLSWLDVLDNLEIPREKLIRWYAAWQSKVLCSKSKTYVRLKRKKKAIRKVMAGEISVKHNASESIYRILHKVRRLL